jgi:hypothetical protein
VVVGVTSQPVDLTFVISKTPNCVQDPTFTLSPDNQTWLTKTINVDGESGFIRTNGATLANIGTYARTLTAVVDAQTTPVSFTVVIKDPCQASNFVNGSTPADIIITMPSAGPTSQTQYIMTDVQTNYPTIICPYSAVLAPTKTWISWNPAGPNKITVNHGSIVTPTDYGVYAFTFTVNSTPWPSDVPQKIYNFSVEIKCDVTSLNNDLSASNIDPYVLNQGALTTTNALTISQTPACNYGYTYVTTCKKNAVSITCPTWLVWSLATRKYTMDVTAVADIGLYEVTTTT